MSAMRVAYNATAGLHKLCSSKAIEDYFTGHTVLAELLERRGTEEALTEARTIRDEFAQLLAKQEAARTELLGETRATAAAAVRQWRRREARPGKSKSKGKKKSRRSGKAKGKGASSAAAIAEESTHEPAEAAAAVEGAAAVEAEQQPPVEESEPQHDEGDEEEREECAICLQDLQLVDDEEDPGGDDIGEGEALVVLQCGHRFHAICGDMWCAKCANKGWGVTCPAVEHRMW
jgi:hypothetical protein